MTQSTMWTRPRDEGSAMSARTSFIVPTCSGCGNPSAGASCTWTWWVCCPMVVMLRVVSSSSRLPNGARKGRERVRSEQRTARQPSNQAAEAAPNARART